MASPTMTIGQILTDAEIQQAFELYRNDPLNFHARVLEEIVKPNMERINKALGPLGQLNDPDYIAYAIEYVMMKSSR